jgi:phosphoglycolate phosphatase
VSYEAVVFDNDGVIVELSDWSSIRESVRETFVSFGVEPRDEDVEALLRTTPEGLRAVCRHHDLDPAELWKRRDANASAVQQEAIRAGEKPLYDDVSALSTLPSTLGMVSNNQQETVSFIVEHFDLPAFEVVYGREPTPEGIERKKPNGHYIERALEALDCAPEEALYVGDSDVDVLAARSVGTDSAFIRRDHRVGYDLPVTPTHEIDSLHELEGLFDG